MSASIWKIGGYDIIVNGDGGKPDPKISEHYILDGHESVLHYFGYGSPSRTLTGHLLDTSDDKPDIDALCETATPSTLTSDQGSEGTWVIMSIQWQRVPDIKRTKPVWRFTMELKKA
jgi:hypothetical protein